MAGPYDAVVSIGGQSFVDGVWRLLGPALEGITNPLPIALPGFSNAQMRITQIVPVLPATGALNVLAKVEVTAEALLQVVATTNAIGIALGQQTFNLGGTIDLPAQTGEITNIVLGGGGLNLGPGTGDVSLDAVTGAALNAAGTIDLPSQIPLPPIPFPTIVPVAVDLTPGSQLALPAVVRLAAFPPSNVTRFSLALMALDVSLGPVGGIDPGLPATVTGKLQSAVAQIVGQLGLPAGLTPPLDVAVIQNLLLALPDAVAVAFDDALTRLIAETGRLIYPPGGPGASCEAMFLPTAADVQLNPVNNGSYVLHIGFKRPNSTDIANFPVFTPDAIECQVLIGNTLLMNLLCCLVERLPAFVFPQGPIQSSHDVAGDAHTQSYNFILASVTVGPITLGGSREDGLSVCIDGDAIKLCSLVGRFGASVPNPIPLLSSVAANMATIELKFALHLNFDLDDVASIANLRLIPVPQVTVRVSPSIPLMAAIAVILAVLFLASGSLLGSLLGGGAVAAAAVGIVFALGYIVSGAVAFLLRKATPTVLSGASLLRSPPAVPPGLFEAFGRLSPATVELDDLIARGVLHTPTSPWGLLPRIGLARPREPGGTGTLTTHAQEPEKKGSRSRKTRNKDGTSSGA